LNAPTPIREGFLRGDDADEGRPVLEHGPAPKFAAEPAAPAEIEPAAQTQPARRAAAEPPPPIDLNAPPPDAVWPVTLKLLYRPTRDNNNKVIHELTLRAPTARDIASCGNPVRINHENDVLVDEAKMTQMLAALSGVYPPMIEMLDARDWISCSFFLQRFFLPNPATWIPS
jgi:hypothetical protein